MCQEEQIERRAGELYQVLVGYDGCSNWTIDLPEANNVTQDEAVEFISKHLPPKGYDQMFDLQIVGGRSVSYMVTPATRRVRLHEQDLKIRV